jgi:hypothetical protein
VNELSGAVARTLEGRVINDLMVVPKVLVDPEVEWFTPTDEQKHLTPFPWTRANRRQFRRGSRAHVSRMAHRRKTPPSLATHLAVRTEAGIARVWHPDYLRKMEERARADAVSDAGEGRRR